MKLSVLFYYSFANAKVHKLKAVTVIDSDNNNISFKATMHMVATVGIKVYIFQLLLLR